MSNFVEITGKDGEVYLVNVSHVVFAKPAMSSNMTEIRLSIEENGQPYYITTPASYDDLVKLLSDR